jgi:hemerythrin-like metal-binding protein
MSFINWDGSLTLDHAIIDQDHQALSVAVGRVVDAVASPCAADGRDAWRARIAVALADLKQRTATHFGSEEWIMDAAGYPKLAAHRMQHQVLLDELDTFAAGELLPGEAANADAARFFHQWFDMHIQIWDRALVRWLGTLDPARQAEA